MQNPFMQGIGSGIDAYAQGGIIPAPANTNTTPNMNGYYPMSNLQRNDSAYDPMLPYSHSSELLGAGDTQIDPFSGEEKFAEGGTVARSFPGEGIFSDALSQLTPEQWNAPTDPQQLNAILNANKIYGGGPSAFGISKYGTDVLPDTPVDRAQTLPVIDGGGPNGQPQPNANPNPYQTMMQPPQGIRQMGGFGGLAGGASLARDASGNAASADGSMNAPAGGPYGTEAPIWLPSDDRTRIGFDPNEGQNTYRENGMSQGIGAYVDDLNKSFAAAPRYKDNAGINWAGGTGTGGLPVPNPIPPRTLPITPPYVPPTPPSVPPSAPPKTGGDDPTAGWNGDPNLRYFIPDVKYVVPDKKPSIEVSDTPGPDLNPPSPPNTDINPGISNDDYPDWERDLYNIPDKKPSITLDDTPGPDLTPTGIPGYSYSNTENSPDGLNYIDLNPIENLREPTESYYTVPGTNMMDSDFVKNTISGLPDNNGTGLNPGSAWDYNSIVNGTVNKDESSPKFDWNNPFTSAKNVLVDSVTNHPIRTAVDAAGSIFTGIPHIGGGLEKVIDYLSKDKPDNGFTPPKLNLDAPNSPWSYTNLTRPDAPDVPTTPDTPIDDPYRGDPFADNYGGPAAPDVPTTPDAPIDDPYRGDPFADNYGGPAAPDVPTTPDTPIDDPYRGDPFADNYGENPNSYSDYSYDPSTWAWNWNDYFDPQYGANFGTGGGGWGNDYGWGGGSGSNNEWYGNAGGTVPTPMAAGGLASLPEYKAGGLLNGPGDGMSDSIPAVIKGKQPQRAALADGEFVVPADVVSHLGNGSTKAGSARLYEMMDRIRHARTGNPKQGKQINPHKFLPV